MLFDPDMSDDLSSVVYRKMLCIRGFGAAPFWG